MSEVVLRARQALNNVLPQLPDAIRDEIAVRTAPWLQEVDDLEATILNLALPVEERQAALADLVDLVFRGGPPTVSPSFTEQSTGKRDINGNRIFQKSINLGSLPAAGSFPFPHGIVNLNRITSWNVNAFVGTNDACLPFVQVGSDGVLFDGIQISRNGADIVINVGVTDRSAFTAFAILEYTKL